MISTFTFNKEFDHIAYNKVIMKASHNSYNRDEQPVSSQLLWNPIISPFMGPLTYQRSCSALELDIWQKGDGDWQWKVHHTQPVGDEGKAFSTYLQDLNTWSTHNPGHRPISIFIDLKNDPNSSANKNNFPKEIDNYITKFIPRTKFCTPKDIMNGEKTLIDGVKTHGWPTIGQLKGKFIICFTSPSDLKEYYLDNNYEDALCFCAARTPDEVNVNKIFYNIHVYKSSTRITPGGYKLNDSKLRKLYDSGLYFIRGWVLSHESIWNEALHKYQVLNALATNEISNQQWAGVGIYPFAELK